MNSPDESHDQASVDVPVTATGSEPAPAPAPAQEPRDVEFSGDAALDARLAEPVLHGYRGIDTAQLVMSGFLVVVVGAIAYCNSLDGGFIGLDRTIILENDALHRLTAVPETVVAGGPGPLAVATLALNWVIAPASATAFQVVNVLVHLLNALLLYLVARTLLRHRTSEAVCMTAGLLLAVLPVATGSVNYFVARGALLGTSFSLLALLVAHRAVSRPDGGTLAMGVSIICLLGAAACTAPAILLPLITIAYLWTVSGAHAAKRWLPWVAGLVLLQAALLVVYYTLATSAPGRIIAAPSFMIRALLAAFLPINLSIGHGLPYFSYVLTAVVAFLSGSFTLALLVLRRRPGVPLLWFLVFSSATAAMTSPGSLLAAHSFYLPLAGLLLLVPWVLTRLPSGASRVAAGVAVAIAILTMGWFTLHRNAVWSDPIGLWAEAAERFPESFEPRHELGRLYVEEGDALFAAASQRALTGTAADAPMLREEATTRFTEAVALLERSIALGDPHVEPHLLLARAQLRLGNDDASREALLDALSEDSANYDATLQLATLWESRVSGSGDREDAVTAIDYYERARALQTMSPERLARLGMLLASVGRFEQADDALREAVGDNPNSPFREALASVTQRVSELQQLEQTSAAQMRANPADPQGLRARAQAHLIRGKYLQAAYVLERNLLQHPEDYGSWLYLGMARAKMGGAAEFVSAHPPAPAEPGTSPWRDLAERVAALGSWDAAQAYLAQDTSASEAEKALTLASWAVAQRELEEASAAVARAKSAAAEDPRPWIYQVDIALLNGNLVDAEQALAEAQRLGADAAALSEREQRIEQARDVMSAATPSTAEAQP